MAAPPRCTHGWSGLGSGPWCVYVWDGRSRESRMVNRRAGVLKMQRGPSVARSPSAKACPPLVAHLSLARSRPASTCADLYSRRTLAEPNTCHTYTTVASNITTPPRRRRPRPRPTHPPCSLCRDRASPSITRCITRACFLATTLLRVLHPISCAHFAQLSHRAHL